MKSYHGWEPHLHFGTVRRSDGQEASGLGWQLATEAARDAGDVVARHVVHLNPM